MKPLAFITVAGLAVAAFAAGRTLGAHRQDAPRVDITVEETSRPSVASVPQVPQPTSPESPAHTAAPELPAQPATPASSWQRVLHEAPDAAALIHAAVIRTMEPRRRAIAWKRCAPPTSIGRSSLLFQVDVTLRDDHLVVRDAHFVGAEDGVEIGADVGACIASQLAGNTDVPLAAGLASYAGQVEYRFTVDFGT